MSASGTEKGDGSVNPLKRLYDLVIQPAGLVLALAGVWYAHKSIQQNDAARELTLASIDVQNRVAYIQQIEFMLLENISEFGFSLNTKSNDQQLLNDRVTVLIDRLRSTLSNEESPSESTVTLDYIVARNELMSCIEEGFQENAGLAASTWGEFDAGDFAGKAGLGSGSRIERESCFGKVLEMQKVLEEDLSTPLKVDKTLFDEYRTFFPDRSKVNWSYDLLSILSAQTKIDNEITLDEFIDMILHISKSEAERRIATLD